MRKNLRCTVVLVKTENSREKKTKVFSLAARPIANRVMLQQSTKTFDSRFLPDLSKLSPFESFSLSLFLSRARFPTVYTDTCISFPFHSVKIIPHTRCATSFFVLPKLRPLFFTPLPLPFFLPLWKRFALRNDQVISWYRAARVSSPPPLFFAPAMGHTHFYIREYEIYMTRTKFRVE